MLSENVAAASKCFTNSFVIVQKRFINNLLQVQGSGKAI
jgi:hypothetical protein